MLSLRMTVTIGWLGLGAILATFSAIAPPAPATPRSVTKMAVESTPTCFIEQSNQTTIDLDRLCGLDRKRAKVDRNRVIDLSIDVNRDGISDQLLETAQENLDAREAAQKQSQNLGTDAEINALSKLREEFDARMPYSDQVRKLLAEEQRVSEQFGKLTPQEQDRNHAAILAKQAERYQKYSQDPSYIRVEQARSKVYEEIERRGSAKWLFSSSSN
jgi:hypothetical protein